MHRALLLLLCAQRALAACTPGTYSVPPSTACLACPAGTYCALSTGCESACSACPPNSGSQAGASTCIGPFCQSCPVGYFCVGGTSIQARTPLLQAPGIG